MTKEDVKDKVINYALGQKINDGINTLDNLINKIFDEHEKEKEHWVLHCDGLVSAHKHQCEAYEKQLKAKEKEIKMLHNLIQKQHVSQPIKMRVCEQCGKELGGVK